MPGGRDDGERTVEAREDQRSRLADLHRKRRVDHVGGGEAVVEPATFLSQLLADGVDEGGGVVVQRRLELGDPFRARRHRLGDAGRGLVRHDSELGPGRRGCLLDLEPGRELSLVRPDPGHGRAGVAGDHGLQSRALACRSHLPLTGDRDRRNPPLLWRGF